MRKIEILWVDDEIDLLKPHIIYLEGKGYDLTPAKSGDEALDILEVKKFDLIFLDENMPGLSGLETLTILKEKYEIETSKKRGKKKLFVKFSKKINKLPFKMYFPKSNIEISLLIPLIIGVFAGSLVSMMGIGGGFVIIPAMIYILKMPHKIITGTSLFQIVFISIVVTMMQSVVNNAVDIILAAIMIAGSVIGVQFGIKKAKNMDNDNLKLMLAIMILLVCLKMFSQLFLEPSSLYSIEYIK